MPGGGAKNAKPKGWGVWKCPVDGSGGEGWWMRPGRGIVLWRFKAPDGKEFDAEAAALEYAQVLGAGEHEDEDEGEGEDAAAQQDEAEKAGDGEQDETEPADAAAGRAVASKAILKAYTNTIPPQEGPKNCVKCRSGRGVCRKPGAKGHLQLRGAETLQLQPEPKQKRALAATDGVPAQVASGSCPPAKRPAPLERQQQQQQQPPPPLQPQKPSVARSGRVRKAVSRWSEDPLSSVNLGGRQELLTAVVTGAVSSEKEFHEAKLAKQREEQAMFRAEQDRVRQEEAEARREAAARLEAMRELQEAAVAEVKKGFAAKSQAGFKRARVEYLQDISALRSDLGLAVEPTQREHARVSAPEGATAAATAPAAYDKVSTESEWLRQMQRKCRQQAGVILMQQQQRLREQELAAAHMAANVALGGVGATDEPRQRSRRVHPSVRKQR